MKKSLVLSLACLLAGCSSFKSSQQALFINCTPPDAYVTVNGDRVQPPVTLQMRRNARLTVEARKDGFMPYTKTISYHLNGTGITDAVGTLFIGFSGFGVLFPGAWDLNETNVNIQMFQTEAASSR